MCMRRWTVLFLSLAVLAVPTRAQTDDATVSAADAAFSAKQYASAIDLYQKVLSSSQPDDVRARAASRIAYAWHASGDKGKARAAWEWTAQQFAHQPQYAADALLRAGNLAAAGKDISGAASLYERAVNTYATQEGLAETVVQAASHLGYMRLKQFEASKAAMRDLYIPLDTRENHAAALAAFRKVGELFPTHAEWVSDAEMNILELVQQGVFYGYGGEIAEVLEGCDRFLESYPSDPKRTPVVMLIRAESLRHTGKLDEAVLAISRLRKVWPGASREIMGTSQRLLATCYADMGEWEKALAAYRSFLDGGMTSYIPKVDRPYAQYEVGRLLRLMGRSAEARIALKKVREDYPESGYVKSADYELVALDKGAF